MSVKELLVGSVVLVSAGGIIYSIIALIAEYTNSTKNDVTLDILVIASISAATILCVIFLVALATVIGEWAIRKFGEYKNTKKYTNEFKDP